MQVETQNDGKRRVYVCVNFGARMHVSAHFTSVYVCIAKVVVRLIGCAKWRTIVRNNVMRVQMTIVESRRKLSERKSVHKNN